MPIHIEMTCYYMCFIVMNIVHNQTVSIKFRSQDFINVSFLEFFFILAVCHTSVHICTCFASVTILNVIAHNYLIGGESVKANFSS